MRISILAIPVLLASSAMGAVRLIYSGDAPDDVWRTNCDTILKDKQGCGVGLGQENRIHGTEGDSLLQLSSADWKYVGKANKIALAWCRCGDPNKQNFSYARQVAEKLNWTVKEGEEDLVGVLVNFQAYKDIYEQKPVMGPWGPQVVQIKWLQECLFTVEQAEGPRAVPKQYCSIDSSNPAWTARVDCRDDNYKDFTSTVIQNLSKLGIKLHKS